MRVSPVIPQKLDRTVIEFHLLWHLCV